MTLSVSLGPVDSQLEVHPVFPLPVTETFIPLTPSPISDTTPYSKGSIPKTMGPRKTKRWRVYRRT